MKNKKYRVDVYRGYGFDFDALMTREYKEFPSEEDARVYAAEKAAAVGGVPEVMRVVTL